MGFSRHSISFCRVVLLSGSCGDFVEFSLEPLDLMFELPEADTVWSDEHEIRGDPAIVMPGRTRDIDVGARLTWYVFGLTREENESKGITGESHRRSSPLSLSALLVGDTRLRVDEGLRTAREKRGGHQPRWCALIVTPPSVSQFRHGARSSSR